MKRVATAVVLIPLVLFVIFFLDNWIFRSAVGVIALISLFEFLKLSGKFSTPPVLIPVVVLIGTFGAVTLESSWNNADWGTWPLFVAVLILLQPFIYLVWSLSRPDLPKAVAGSSLAFLGFFYVAVPLLCLEGIRSSYMLGNYFLVLLLLAVWCGDIAAFYVGKAFGKHKLAPVISPGKTWEGAFASLLFSVAVVFFVTQFLGPKLSGTGASRYLGRNMFSPIIKFEAPAVWFPICFGIVVNAAAQIGDLTESMLKRAAGVKDSGTLLPGHGGMLDRIDALLFAAPVAALLFLLTEDRFQATPQFWNVR